MSEPKKEQSREEKKRKSSPWRFVIFGALFLVLVLVVCALLFPQTLGVDRLRRYLTYGDISTGADQENISYDAGTDSAYGAFSGGLAVANETGLCLYDYHGQTLVELSGMLSAPVIQSSGKVVLCADMGGSFLGVVSAKGKQLLHQNVTGTLLDADLSSGGYVCYTMTESGYKSVATVCNPSMQEVYKWYSSSKYLSQCAASPSGRYVALVGLGQQDSTFSSTVTVLETTSEEPVAQVELGNTGVYEMKFLEENRICLVAEDRVVFLDVKGHTLATVDCSQQYIADFAFSEDGYLVLAVNQSKAGNTYTMYTYTPEGKQLGTCGLSAELSSLSAAGGYVALLTGNGLTIYNKKLTVYSQAAEIAASRALAQEDGSVLLISAGSAAVYVP